MIINAKFYGPEAEAMRENFAGREQIGLSELLGVVIDDPRMKAFRERLVKHLTVAHKERCGDIG